MSIKFIFKSLRRVYGYVYHFCYSRHVSYSPSSYFSQDNTCTNDCTANNCSTNDCATNYCATHHCSTVSTVMIHINDHFGFIYSHLRYTLFTTIFFTGLRPNQPHLNHLLPNQPPRMHYHPFLHQVHHQYLLNQQKVVPVQVYLQQVTHQGHLLYHRNLRHVHLEIRVINA